MQFPFAFGNIIGKLVKTSERNQLKLATITLNVIIIKGRVNKVHTTSAIPSLCKGMYHP